MGKITKLDDIVSLCKRRGFIFQSSEIYGGLASCYDYGPLGVGGSLPGIVYQSYSSSAQSFVSGAVNAILPPP